VELILTTLEGRQRLDPKAVRQRKVVQLLGSVFGWVSATVAHVAVIRRTQGGMLLVEKAPQARRRYCIGHRDDQSGILPADAIELQEKLLGSISEVLDRFEGRDEVCGPGVQGIGSRSKSNAPMCRNLSLSDTSMT